MNIFNKLLVFITLIASSVASSLGIIHQPSIKHEEPTSIRTASPSAVITPAPTKQPEAKQVVNSSPQPTAKHDGSRTGQIIDYQELCTGKTIKIYENELITQVAADGKTYTRTQGDWNCLSNTSVQQKPNSPNNTNYPSNGGNSAGNNYIYSQPYTYTYPSNINNGNTQQTTYQQIPTNTPQPVDHSRDLQLCLSQAQANYNAQMDALNARGFASSGQADQVKSDYAAQQQSCHQQYGN